MNRRALLLPLLLAVIGYGALSLLAAKAAYNPAALYSQGGYSLDRAQAIAATRSAAARYGLDAASWEPRVTAEYQPETAYYLSRHQAAAESLLLSPVVTTVQLVEKSGHPRSFTADLTPGGRLAGFKRRDAASQERVDVALEETRRAAHTALADLTADTAGLSGSTAGLNESTAGRFTLVSEVNQGDEGIRFTWEQTLPEQRNLKLQATTLVQNQTIKELRLDPKFAPRFVEEYNRRRNSLKLFDVFSGLLVILAGLGAAVFYLVSWSRGEIDQRLTWTLFGVLLVPGLLLMIYRGKLDEEMIREFDANREKSLAYVGLLLSVLIPPVFYALGVALVWGNGHALARRTHPLWTLSFARLLRGRLLSKLVAHAAAVGILLGGMLSAIPYLVIASGFFPGLELYRPDPAPFISAAPTLVSLIRPLNFPLFTVYGFLIPLASVYLRRTPPGLYRYGGLLLGYLWIINEDVYRSSSLGALVIGALLIIIVDTIFWRYDLLTLAAALLASDITTGAWSLIVQPSAVLRSSGWQVLAALGTVLVAALIVSRSGYESPVEDQRDALPVSLDTAQQQAERERLRAEFGVARRAQQRMLPAAPPSIPGYEIAATCRPAREVGGDLYDFLALPNERIGIVVADVSGKGVPAALYMTLTKGLLASVAESESDPSRILCEVNRHLYEVCRRKSFVTMMLGVLDPGAGTLTYARAGHNPGVWRSASMQTLKLLSAPGLGLGLSKTGMFDRNLQTEAIRIEFGDAVLFYSDGITEAMNTQGEEYSEERLLAAVAGTDGLSAAETQHVILSDVERFLQGTPPQDDITLVVVRVTASL